MSKIRSAVLASIMSKFSRAGIAFDDIIPLLALDDEEEGGDGVLPLAMFLATISLTGYGKDDPKIQEIMEKARDLNKEIDEAISLDVLKKAGFQKQKGGVFRKTKDSSGNTDGFYADDEVGDFLNEMITRAQSTENKEELDNIFGDLSEVPDEEVEDWESFMDGSGNLDNDNNNQPSPSDEDDSLDDIDIDQFFNSINKKEENDEDDEESAEDW